MAVNKGNKKQMKMTSSKRDYVTKTEIFQELEAIKNDIKEVKKAVVAPKKEIKKEDAKITRLEVQKDKLVAQLSDGRELSIPIAWFAKWGIKNVIASKLKKYEIWHGSEVYFPIIDEVVGIETFIGGFDAPCE